MRPQNYFLIGLQRVQLSRVSGRVWMFGYRVGFFINKYFGFQVCTSGCGFDSGKEFSTTIWLNFKVNISMKNVWKLSNYQRSLLLLFLLELQILTIHWEWKLWIVYFSKKKKSCTKSVISIYDPCLDVSSFSKWQFEPSFYEINSVGITKIVEGANYKSQRFQS